MTPSNEEALRLLRLAQRDLQTYRILADHPDASLAATCFHAQQSVEKALKAVLTARRATFPRTHNLEELGLLVAETGIGLPAPTTDFRRLTPFAGKRLAHPPVKPGRSGATSRFSTGGRDGQGRGTGSALAGACGRLAGERRQPEGVL
jgi:hypothetical protein